MDSPMILSDTTNIVIAGGGTTDVLLPGLAVADELRTLVLRPRIIFAGSGDSSEYQQVRDSGYEYQVAGSHRDVSWRRGIIHRLIGPSPVRRVLTGARPALVLSMGGEVGEAVGRAASRMGLPLIVFEPHVHVSHATRRLAPLADLICLAFDETKQELAASCPVRVTGIPVRRSEMLAGDGGPSAEDSRSGRRIRRLVILGDDEHSRQLNAVLPRALKQLSNRLLNWRVVHRAKSDEVRPIRRMYARSGIDAVATAHVHKLPELLARADLVIAATSLMELVTVAAAGRPTIVAVGSDGSASWQSEVGRNLARNGACVVVDEVDQQSRWTRVLGPLLSSQQGRRRLQTAMQSQFRRDAAWHLASMIHDRITSSERYLSA
jgi:UDP-N-acetylglucosamine--N-acetylmuramyl-(pentapeptide) pyrophosphoryl-undecaprenol N-acetylglucosamine transferase